MKGNGESPLIGFRLKEKDPFAPAVFFLILYPSFFADTQVRNKVGRFYGNGAYDPWGVRGQLEKRGTEQVIPPRKDAVIKQHGNSKEPRLGRDEAVRNICKYGRKGWKRHMGYHRRSLVETAW